MENYQQNKNHYQANVKARLERDSNNKRIAGVCAGIASYFQTSASLVRIIWFLLAFVGIFSAGISTFFVVCTYLVLWFIMPKKSAEYECTVQNI